jgi:HK97 family phage prohead protease
MTPKLKRAFSIESKSSINEMARTVRVIASTDALDSYGEVVEQKWDLQRFMRNPVVLYNHDSRMRPIGKATECQVVNGRLEATIQLSKSKSNAKAQEVWEDLNEGLINAVSVGFSPRSYREEMRSGVECLVLSDNELFEISFVPLPANPDAVVLSEDPDRWTSRGELVELARKAASSGKEHTMNESENTPLEEKSVEAAPVNELELRHAELASKHDDLQVKLAELEARHAALEAKAARVDALEARNAELELVIAERDVDDLIGKKLLPSEREEMLELRKANKDLFVRLTAKRPELQLAQQITQPDAVAPKTNLAAGSDRLAEYVNKLVDKS